MRIYVQLHYLVHYSLLSLIISSFKLLANIKCFTPSSQARLHAKVSISAAGKYFIFSSKINVIVILLAGIYETI